MIQRVSWLEEQLSQVEARMLRSLRSVVGAPEAELAHQARF